MTTTTMTQIETETENEPSLTAQLAERETELRTQLVTDAYRAGLIAGAQAALRAQNQPMGDALAQLNSALQTVLASVGR